MEKRYLMGVYCEIFIEYNTDIKCFSKMPLIRNTESVASLEELEETVNFFARSMLLSDITISENGMGVIVDTHTDFIFDNLCREGMHGTYIEFIRRLPNNIFRVVKNTRMSVLDTNSGDIIYTSSLFWRATDEYNQLVQRRGYQ